MRELNYTHKGEEKLVREILKSHFGFSKGVITSLKTDSGMFVNNEPVTVRRIMKENDILTIKLPDEKSENIVPVEMELDIIYEDEDILVVNKPSGMPTHPSIRHFTDTLANGVCYMYKDRDFMFRAVTRLDRETSGIVLIAKNRNSAHKLGEQLKNGMVEKTYYALCEGVFEKSEGEIEAPIARMCESIILRHVSKIGKYSKTLYKVISKENEMSFVEVTPVTGRTHQIRVHLSYIGHPIFADYLYGNRKDGEKLRLHCGKLVFMHPVTNKKITLSCDIPDYFLHKIL